nr:carbohydrate porin [Oxynema sp. CENA135]
MSPALALPDLGKQGSLGGSIFGAEPYLSDLDVPGNPDFSTDIPFHVEGFYKYQMSDNITITPGLIGLSSPQQNNDNDDVFMGTVRTTFSF